MVIGIKALSYSASQFAEEEEEQLGAKEIALTLALRRFATVGLFIVLPAFVIRQVQAHIASNVLLNIDRRRRQDRVFHRLHRRDLD